MTGSMLENEMAPPRKAQRDLAAISRAIFGKTFK